MDVVPENAREVQKCLLKKLLLVLFYKKVLFKTQMINTDWISFFILEICQA